MVRSFSLFAVVFILYSCAASSARRSFNETPHDECRILEQAVSHWLGTPYRYGGNDRGGLDCSAFVQIVYGDVYGFLLPRTTEQQYASGSWVRGGWLQCGDLLFFRNVRGRGIDHVGIYLGAGRFAHASSSNGVIISMLEEAYYTEHYAGARRYPR